MFSVFKLYAHLKFLFYLIVFGLKSNSTVVCQEKKLDLTSIDGRMKPPLINRQIGATCATLFKGYPCHLFLESYTSYLKRSS